MFKIYTGLNSKEVENVKADVYFPENGISPDEQVQWVLDNYKRDITIVTFSPFILEMFNVIITQKDWTDKNISVTYMYEGNEMNILGTTEDGRYLIDSYDIGGEVMERIHYIYNEALKEKESTTNT